MKITLLSLLILFSSLTHGSPLERLTDLDGKPAVWTTTKDKLLVSLWATWCGECRKKLAGDLPEFNRRSDVAVIAVNTEKDMARVKHFVEKEQVTLPVFVDSEKVLRLALKAFSVPHWAVYRREGGEWKLIDTAPAFEVARIEKALGAR